MAADPAPDSHLNEDYLERNPDSEQGPIDEQLVQLPDPYLNPLEEIVLDTGVIPCSIHGYDHLSRDPTCEFCKKAIGPLYRHLSKKYGTSLGDQTPTLSFDFSGPHPVAVTGARYVAFCMATGYCSIVVGFCGSRKNQGMCAVMFK